MDLDELIPILVIAVIVLIGSLLLISGLNVGSVAGGFTTLSLSKASFQSSNSFFNGEAYILTVVQGGLGQKAQGTISSSDISQETGKTPEKDFTISIDYSEQDCEYQVVKQDSAMQVYTYQLISYSRLDDFWCNNPNVYKQKCPNAIAVGSYGLSECACIEQTQRTGAIAPFIENPNVHTKSLITVGNTQNSYSQNFDSKSQISGFIGSYVYVQWNGNLVVDTCPNQAPYYSFYSSNGLFLGSTWKIGQKTNYDNYVNVKATQLTESNINQCDGAADKKACVQGILDNVNAAANKAMTFASFGVIEGASSTENAVIKQSLSSSVQVPVYTFYVKADFLGIIQPAPKPSIVSVSSQKFKSGDVGFIDVTIKNVGTDSGNVNVWAECQAPFTTTESTKTVSLGAGQQSALYLKISADTTQPVTRTCTVKAQALDQLVTAAVTVSADPNIFCTAGAESCSENQRLRCNAYGTGFELIEDCSAKGLTCNYVTSTSTSCVKSGSGGGDDDKKGFFGWLWEIFLEIIKFLGGFFGGGLLGQIAGFIVFALLVIVFMLLLIRRFT